MNTFVIDLHLYRLRLGVSQNRGFISIQCLKIEEEVIVLQCQSAVAFIHIGTTNHDSNYCIRQLLHVLRVSCSMRKLKKVSIDKCLKL